jgi:5'-3' exoribonuclease 1
MKSRQKGEVIDESTLFDSNCITPGTEFMEIVDKHLRWFIHKKMKEDPVWRDLEVIYSGHGVPGEGEHKIIQHIRNARVQPNYQPNQRHCLYGQDADLIMLGLATHEPHFTLLREVVDFGGGRSGIGQRDTVMKQTKDARFQLLHLSVLREYIEVEFANNHKGEPLDRERLVDDFIFLTFLVGNDFLPHLPTLDIGENAFDVIFDIYRSLQAESLGYIVGNGEIVDFVRLQKLFAAIGVQESEILRTREVEQKEFNARRRKGGRYGGRGEDMVSAEEEENEEEELQRALEQAIVDALEEERARAAATSHPTPNTSTATSVSGTPPPTPTEEEEGGVGWLVAGGRPLVTTGKTEGDRVPTSKDYHARYYYEKFRMISGSSQMKEFLPQLCFEYLRGLIWCLAYYMKGCVSWTWFYPYHYGPMLVDMRGMEEMASRIRFDLGSPFLPFQQLLGCLPPTSKSMLPAAYQWIMTSPLSPILEYYPTEFEVDMNGKRNPWEAVVLLPFIDSTRLLDVEQAHCPEGMLTPQERERNSFGEAARYVFDPQNMATIPSCNPGLGLMDIPKCNTSVQFFSPPLSPGVSFIPRLIPGTVKTCAGFPSLGVLAISAARLEAVKLNIFGSESRYRSTILTVLPRPFSPDQIDLKLLLGRSVFVNYPLIHEAKVVGVSCETRTYRLRSKRVVVGGKATQQVEVEEKSHDATTRTEWQRESSQEEGSYLRGRKEPGTGGIEVGPIAIRLRVVPVQGMHTDRVTGVRKKVFGETEADIPIQVRHSSTNSF